MSLYWQYIIIYYDVSILWQWQTVLVNIDTIETILQQFILQIFYTFEWFVIPLKNVYYLELYFFWLQLIFFQNIHYYFRLWCRYAGYDGNKDISNDLDDDNENITKIMKRRRWWKWQWWWWLYNFSASGKYWNWK